jgi:hypothetical protein
MSSSGPFTVCKDGLIRGELIPDFGELGWANTRGDDQEGRVQRMARPRDELLKVPLKEPKHGLAVMVCDQRMLAQFGFGDVFLDEDIAIAMLSLHDTLCGFRWDEPVVVEDRYSRMARGIYDRRRGVNRATATDFETLRAKRKAKEEEARRQAEEAKQAAEAKAKVDAELNAEQARREKAEEAIKRILEHHASIRLKRKGDRKFLDDCELREDLQVAKMRHKEALRVARWKFDFYTRVQQNLEMADKADAEKRRLEANPPGQHNQQKRQASRAQQANCAWEAPRGQGRRGGRRSQNAGRQPRHSQGRDGQKREERFYPSYACAKCGDMHPSNLLRVPGINDIKATAGFYIERVVDIIQSGTIRCPKCATSAEPYKLAQTIGMLNKIEQKKRRGGDHEGGDRRDREAS